MRHVSILIIAILVLTCQLPAVFSQETGIVVTNGKTRIIENVPAIMTGDILVEKNSTLIMRNVVLQLSLRGEKGYNITVRDRSTLVLRKSTLVTLNAASNITIGNSSSLIIEDESSITGFLSLKFDNSSLASLKSTALGIGYVTGSTDKLEMSQVSAVGTLMNVSSLTARVDASTLKDLHLRADQLNVKGLRITNLKVQCGTANLRDIQAQMLNVKATEQIYASNLIATTSDLYASVNVTITDSIFGTLTSGRGQLYNVTTSRSPLVRAGGMIYTYDNSTVKRYWNLKVNVTDITMMPVPATIEIRDYNMTQVDVSKVGVDGTVSKPILSEIITSSVPTFIGNFKISARYKTYATKPETIVLDTNKKMNVVFPDEIPGLASVTLTISPQPIFTGDKATIKGKIRVPMKDNIVELTYVTPDGSKLARAAITDKDGAFTDEVVMTMAGKWRLQAYWVGGEPYSEGVASISRPTAFQVVAKQSILNMIIFMIPILLILIATIIGIALMFLKKGGITPIPISAKPKRTWRLHLPHQLKNPLKKGAASPIPGSGKRKRTWGIRFPHQLKNPLKKKKS